MNKRIANGRDWIPVENVSHLALSTPPITAPYYFGGPLVRCGTSGLTSVTAFSRSSTTFGPYFFPASRMAFISSSAHLFASSSACLLPLECYMIWEGPSEIVNKVNLSLEFAVGEDEPPSQTS